MNRFVLVLLFAGLLPLFAQVPSISPADRIEHETVEGLLASKEPSQIAWGAYLSANYQQKSFIPAIIELLRSENDSLRFVALDSLIRLHADVPENILTPLTGQYFDEVMILISTQPAKHTGFLMRLLQGSLSDKHWMIINSLLSSVPPPGYAATLLKDWTIRVNAVVMNPGIPGGVPGGNPGGLCGTSFQVLQQKFPTILRYALFEGISQGETVVATGIHPLSYRRQHTPSDCLIQIPRDQYRFDYLKSLVYSPAEATGLLCPDLHIFNWTNQLKYRADTEAFLDSIRRVVRPIRQTLIDRHLLTNEESKIGPSLEVKVIDQRYGNPPPLAVIDWRL